MTDNNLPADVTDFLIVDDNGMPIGSANIDQIQAQATRLAFEMAEHCGDPDELTQVTIRHMQEVGATGFGYVTAAALRIMTEHILDPLLDLTDALHQSGRFPYDARAGLADAAGNAREAL